jgi:virulence factor Mce-like protein
MTRALRIGVPLLVLVLAVVAAVVVFGGGSDQKKLTAMFPRTVSLYEGSDVRILGVPVGKVEKITPEGELVKVEMTYDGDVDVPDTAQAVIISPAIVGDRYVQLTPAFQKGDKALADDTVLDESRTAVPLELDEIYSSLNELNVALGPDGANSEGALTDLLEVTADNFGGQGEQFNSTITNFSRLTATLDDNKDELFGSARALSRFIETLAQNDGTVRAFNRSLGRVSTVLADEREELAAALRNLGIAVGEVGSFVRDNRDVLGKDIRGLNRVLKVLVRQRGALDEVLRIAPVALNNLALTYNPDAGTLDTNSNVSQFVENLEKNPKDVLCALISANDPNGQLCDRIQGLPLPRAAAMLGAGTGSAYGESDPSLGGLVEVSQ